MKKREKSTSSFGSSKYNKKSFVSDRVAVIGKVTLEENVIVAPGCSLRADEGTPFRVCKGTNLQDGVILHGLLEKYVEVDGNRYSIYIGSHCSIAHDATIHGPAKISKKTFVGFDSIIHNSEIGRNCFVDFRATIKGSAIGDRCHIGIGAIINNVKIGDNRYVKDGSVIIHQDDADILPLVPEKIRHADDEFNKEVVDYNKILCKKYKG
jgi:carbonic anhydrase